MKIVDIALSQEGTLEAGLNNIEYNTWYYGYPVSGGSYPYCAVFVSWCAEKAGLSTDIFPKTASVTSLYNFFLERKQFKKRGEHMPSPGDIMIQRSKGASHTGIVIMSDAQGFYTIEGNAGDGVQRCYHYHTDPMVNGFGVPDYPVEYVTKFSAAAPLMAAVNIRTLMSSNASDDPTVVPDTSVTVITPDTGTGTTATTVVTSAKMSETEVWDWLRTNGYTPEATAAICACIKMSSNYDPYYDTLRKWCGTIVGGMGLFHWTYGQSNSDTTIVSDLGAFSRMQFPDSQLSKYLNWCEISGYKDKEQTSLAQLTYFKEQGVSPSSMSSMTVDQAIKYIVEDYCGKTILTETTEANTLYEKYKNRPLPSQTSSTAPEEKGMRGGEVTNAGNIASYSYETYTVQAGDTLESIAAKFNTTPQMILFANNLDEWDVEDGTTLQIPIAQEVLSRSEAQLGVDALKNLINSRTIKVSHPTVEVQFYGEYGKLSAKTTIGKTEKDEYMDNDIISVSTTRNMGQDCPTFTMSLVRRNDWYDNIASNDMVIIFMQRPPEDIHIVMYGLVDDIRRSMDWSSGQPQMSIQITGRGFNKALCNFDIGMLQSFSGYDAFAGFFESFNKMFENMNSAMCIQNVLDAYLDKGLKYRFGDGLTFKEHYVYDPVGMSNEWLVDMQSFRSLQDNLWNFIKKLTNAPFNESYWEIRNDKPTLIHRPTPFEKANWTALPRITIPDYAIIANNTGRSDLETFTLFQVEPAQMSEQMRNVFFPLWYPPHYNKYGLREQKLSTLFGLSKTHDATNPEEYQKLLFNYYIKNSVSENGQITVIGSNQYKVGERIILESEDMEYYVEGVNHNFNMYSNWTTSLSVTRGLHPSERFTPPYGAYEPFTPDHMNAIIKLTSTGTVDWSHLEHVSWSISNADGTSSTSFGTGNSVVGADGQWFSYRNKTWTHPAPQALIITSRFGSRTPPTEGASSFHHGIDLACEGGSDGLPIVAAADGEVVFAGAMSGYGNYISISHGDGLYTGYAHMHSQDIMVSVGQKVVAGQQIARIGNAGVGTAAHLHFELREGDWFGTAIDPEQLFETKTSPPASVQQASASESAYNTIGVNEPPEVVAKSCYDYLKQFGGFNRCACCAVLGNIQQESSFNMVDMNEIGAFGLIQWLGSRKTELYAYCANKGVEVNSVAGQMGFLLHELDTTESRSKPILTGATDSRDAVHKVAVDFGETYERYGTNEEGGRGNYAVDWYDVATQNNW